jgi:PEP-CTERM motif
MRNPIGSASWRRLLFAATLPLALLAEEAAPAVAGSVTVTGANGAMGAPSKPGGAGGSATATAISSDPSNTATATGGAGGIGGVGDPPGAGGHGGAASSTAIASSANSSASATATSTGGNGGRGGLPYPCMHACFPGAQGGGGAASATSSATGGGAGTVVSDATATGGAAGGYTNPAAGTASANASASSTGKGLVGANASAFDPSTFTGEYYEESGERASVTASAHNENGSVVTTADAPRGSIASALSGAAVGSVAESPVPISAGHAVSNAALTPGSGETIGVGAMSAGYGTTSYAITYEGTATFDFSTPKSEALDLYLTSFSSAGLGFDSLLLWVQVNDGDPQAYTFSSLTGSGGAETFFTANKNKPLSLGTVAAGAQSIELLYGLTFNIGTAAAPADGFGFTYALADPPLSAAVPEPSTWVMMALGFAGLAFAGYRARVRPASAPSDRARLLASAR